MSTCKRLIVNADGFGFGAGATKGIIDAIRAGNFITSVSVNANFPDAERVRELIEEFPHISIGVHVNPVVGEPCLPPREIPSLVTSTGFFHHTEFLRLLKKKAISFSELEAELDAQIQKVKELAGERLTHIDSQGHGHLYYFDLFLALAKKWGLQRMRTNAPIICQEARQPRVSRLLAYMRKPHIFCGHYYRRYQMSRARKAGMRMADDTLIVGYAGNGNKTNPDNWIRLLNNLPPGTHEIFCHPAYPDETLRQWAFYCAERRQELDILSERKLRDIAKKVGVELINFNAI